MTSRIYASFLAAWLVLSSFVASRHEASVAHALDRAGRVVHAQVLAHHHGGPSDVHPTSTDDHDECTILAAIHQATRVSAVVALSVAPHIGVSVTPVVPHARRVTTLYRLAPKTSPPDANA